MLISHHIVRAIERVFDFNPGAATAILAVARPAFERNAKDMASAHYAIELNEILGFTSVLRLQVISKQSKRPQRLKARQRLGVLANDTSSARAGVWYSELHQ
jgi:hypothetical protein